MKRNLLTIVTILCFAALFSSCKDFLRELDDVENTSLPNQQSVFADPNDYPAVVKGLWPDWHWANVCYDCDNHLSVAAQGLSCSWGNWGMRESGTIPRIPFINDEAHNVIARAEAPWYQLNSILSNSNQLLKLIIDPEDPKTVLDGTNDITELLTANLYALSGLSLGHLSLLFDKAYAATDEVDDPVALDLVASSEVRDAAILMLDKAIAICNANSFTMTPDYINGVTYSNTEFAQVLSSFKARFIGMHSRTAAENASADWAAVLAATNNGLTEDFAPLGDGFTTWADGKRRYHQNVTWARISQRIITEMADPSQAGAGGPAEYPWPVGVPVTPELDYNLPESDQRLATDMTYMGAPVFPASRGYYFFGTYTYTRYLDYVNSNFSSPMNFLNVTENDLLKAEALVRTNGDKGLAASLINNTRVNRGGLSALTGGDSNQVLLDAIQYERRIELIMTWGGLAWCDRRRNDDLEPGTFTQMPVPARELNVLGLEIYSFP